MTLVQREQSLVTDDHRLTAPIALDHLQKGYHFSLYTLNSEETISRFPTRLIRLKHLHLHGIPVPDAGASRQLVRQYVIGVFQCRALFAYVSHDRAHWLAGGKVQTPERFKVVKRAERTKEVRTVERLAKRAVYALGLDYGVVRLGKATGGKSVVLDVLARPKLTSYMTTAFEQAFASYAKRLPDIVPSSKDVLLGTDPEFIMGDATGRLKLASDYFPYRGLVGCDAIWRGSNRADKPIVELRPRPSNSPRELVLSLHRAMLLAAKKINDPNVRWLAGALPYPGFPIGGHIHFSRVPLTFAFLRALDNYLALPLVLVEDRRGRKRRPKYGFLGDFREKLHGGFEYRTLPSWLISPTLTKGVFGLAKLIACHYPYFNDWPLSDVAVQKAYYDGNKEVIGNIVPRLWRTLTQFDTYREEQKNLDAYYQLLTSGKTWDETEDIRKKWRIPPFHHSRKL
ncbi:putative amidoligase domain-containing protein [Numidum massiliense]|uniref:putative amidoligase domain-containing protein n=1 Tax=Numidum massiliense TaxID=1522315 RepID=UPI0006D5580E|nr:hypothetical protein [Numidum massiliense]